MSALTYMFCAPPATEEMPAPVTPIQTPTTFSMGIGPVKRWSQRIVKAKRKKIVRKPTVEQLRRHLPALRRPVARNWYVFEIAKPPKSWLLSDAHLPYPVSKFLREAGKTFTQIYMEIMKNRRRQQRFFLRYKVYNDIEPSLAVLTTYMKAAIKNQRYRTAFGRLARRWIQKRLRAKNEEDLMTGEKPMEPVTLVDWSSRSVYQFEAKTICRDMVSRLLVTTWTFFPAPKSPRNPYTNQALTEGQFYSLVKQMRRYGQTHWALEALYSAKYNLKEFDRDMYMKLKRTHHNAVFANPASQSAREVLLDFIQDEHHGLGVDYEKEIYEWALEHESHHYKIHEWRIQCEKHYRIQHFPGVKEKDQEEQELISIATKRLCEYPTILVDRYDAGHENKYVRMSDRRIAAAHAEIINIHYLLIVPAQAGAEEEDEDEEEEEAESKNQEDAASTDSDDSSSEAD